MSHLTFFHRTEFSYKWKVFFLRIAEKRPEGRFSKEFE